MNHSELAQLFANTLFLAIVVGIPLYGVSRGIKVFDSFVAGAHSSFGLLIKLIPYLVGMLVAIGMFRASGAIALLTQWLGPMLNKIGLPTELLPLAILRPISGTAATGVMADLIHSHGGNTYISKLAATIMGSTETTLYVVAIYFGSIGIRATRHAIPVGLFADLVGILASIWVCQWIFL